MIELEFFEALSLLTVTPTLTFDSELIVNLIRTCCADPDPDSNLKVLGTRSLPEPMNVTIGQLSTTADGSDCNLAAESHESIIITVANDVTFLNDYGFDNYIQIDDGTGSTTLSSSALDYTVADLRDYYGLTSLEGNILTELRGVFHQDNNVSVNATTTTTTTSHHTTTPTTPAAARQQAAACCLRQFWSKEVLQTSTSLQALTPLLLLGGGR